MIKGIVFDIQRYSIHDGPGIRTTVFLKGCPLNCQWCHNPESQSSLRELMIWPNRCINCGECAAACSHGAVLNDGDRFSTIRLRCTGCGSCVEVCAADAREMVGRETAVESVIAEVERDVAFYDESGGGVTFSGGEPLEQPVFLRSLLEACQEREIHTAVDTCGHVPWEILDTIRSHADLFLFDLKSMDAQAHRDHTGVPNALILENLQALSRAGHEIIVRVPVIPGINDDARNVHQIGVFVASLPHLHAIDLLPYHHAAVDKYKRVDRPYALPGLRPPLDSKLDQIAEILRGHGLQVNIGG